MLKAVENSAFRTEVTELSFQQVVLKVLQVQTRFSAKNKLFRALQTSKRARKTGSFIHLQPIFMRSNSRFVILNAAITSASEAVLRADFTRLALF